MGEGNSDGIAGWEFGKALHVVEAEGIKRALVNGRPYYEVGGVGCNGRANGYCAVE